MKLKGAKYRNKPEQRSPNITLCQEINF
jgi:hypothetical protein